MPELPEIETICNYLQKTVINTVINKVIIRVVSLRRPIDHNLIAILQNSNIKRVYRRAKYILIDLLLDSCNLDLDSCSLIIHLGMSGRLRVVNNEVAAQKHDHVDLILNNNQILRYCDPRRFGLILWTEQDPINHPLLACLGPEPFDSLLTANYLLTMAKGKNLSIKQFIMDHRIVSGVGNIYANEALFLAKIHPQTAVKNLKLRHFTGLIKAITNVLNKAISLGGTTLRDFSDPQGIKGEFSKFLKIYGKKGKNCLACTNLVQQIRLAQRSTFFCNNCQIFY